MSPGGRFFQRGRRRSFLVNKPKTEKAREPTAERMGGHVNLKTVLSQASQI